jgi:hypothetical protein
MVFSNFSFPNTTDNSGKTTGDFAVLPIAAPPAAQGFRGGGDVVG